MDLLPCGRQAPRDGRQTRLQFLGKAGFHAAGVDFHGARFDLPVVSAHVAKLAGAHYPVFAEDGGPEDPAGHGSRLVQIARALLRVEGGTGNVLSEVGKVFVGQQAGDRIPREIRGPPRNKSIRPPFQVVGTGRVGCPEFR